MRYLLLHGFTGTSEGLNELHAPSGSRAPLLGGHLDAPVRGDYWDEVERLAAFGDDCEGLFGYSLGGRLALGILARYPARFRRAVIVSAHPGLRSDAERAARRYGDARFVRLLREEGLTAFVDAWQALPLWASQADLPEPVRQRQREQRLRHRAEGLAQSLIHHGLAEMPDLRPLLGRLETPVWLLAGARDAKFAELSNELLRIIPRAHASLVADAGHNLLIERPDVCTELLREPTS